jgi:hypothetical protein
LSSFDRFEVSGGELRFTHLASEYDFAPRPAHRVSWFVFDPVSETRQAATNEAGCLNAEGYCLAEIVSVEGKVDVYIRNLEGRSQVVGVER